MLSVLDVLSVEYVEHFLIGCMGLAGPSIPWPNDRLRYFVSFGAAQRSVQGCITYGGVIPSVLLALLLGTRQPCSSTFIIYF